MLLSTGYRIEGLEKLKEFISEVETMKCKRRGVNSKKSLMYERAVKIRDQVESDKDFTRFSSKFKVPHQHTSQVKSLAYSANSAYLVSTAVDATNVWKVMKDSANLICSIQNGD